MSDQLILGRKQESRRQKLLREYGPTLYRRAELDVLIGLCIASGLFTKDQFLDYIETMLKQEDDARRVAARIKD